MSERSGATRQRAVHTPRPAAAGKSPAAWAVLLATIIIATTADLWSKHAAFERVASVPVDIRRADVLDAERLGELIPRHEPVTVVPHGLEFTLVLNPGAVFGIGAGQRWIFVAFTLVALAVGGLLFARWTTPRDRGAHVAIGLLVAGGLGNLYDRLALACVRDFIHPLPGVNLPFGLAWPNGATEIWPWVSNVADLWLLIGIGVLLVLTWRHPAEQPAEQPVDQPADEPKADQHSAGEARSPEARSPEA